MALMPVNWLKNASSIAKMIGLLCKRQLRCPCPSSGAVMSARVSVEPICLRLFSASARAAVRGEPPGALRDEK